MTRRQRSEAAALAVGLVAGVWRWRLELALLALALGVERLLVEVAALAAPSRRLLWAVLRRAWLRRSWERAACDAGLADGPLRAPRLLGAMRAPVGDVLRVRVRRGQSVVSLDARG